ncbi:hypothetical protein ppKF707_1051 [Metapseudomonas furukawaii]|nr:hypothetical protein ppKF707_1051 [Pseudomonas furukawaii]
MINFLERILHVHINSNANDHMAQVRWIAHQLQQNSRNLAPAGKKVVWPLQPNLYQAKRA